MSSSHNQQGHHGDVNGHPPGHKSEDQIDFAKVIAVGVVSLIETAKTQAATGVSRYPDLAKAEIGIVDQVLFEGDHRLATWRAERAARLNGYGWSDRSKGIVHIPIERALEEAASGALPDGAPK
jgi:hypothetical protein